MVRARPTKRRILVGIALIAIGLAVLGLNPMSLSDILLFSLATFTSVTTILLGIALIGSMPMKTILIALFIAGLWFFLFVLPFSLLPLPQGVPPIVLGFSTLALVLVVGWYERRKTRVNKK